MFTDDLVNYINQGKVIQDSWTPATIGWVKPVHSPPWLNNTREIYRKCTEAGWKLKRTFWLCLTQFWKKLISTSYKAVKEARSSYFSNINAANCHKSPFQSYQICIKPSTSSTAWNLRHFLWMSVFLHQKKLSEIKLCPSGCPFI